jgi:hypothetical protein
MPWSRRNCSTVCRLAADFLLNFEFSKLNENASGYLPLQATEGVSYFQNPGKVCPLGQSPTLNPESAWLFGCRVAPL